MSSLWYANSLGGKRKARHHMGPFLITDTDRPIVATASASAAPTTHRHRVASVPTPTVRRPSTTQSVKSASKAASSKTTDVLRETIVPPPPTTLPPLRTPETLRRPRRSSERREEPNRISVYSAPRVRMSISTLPKSDKGCAKMSTARKVSVSVQPLPSTAAEATTNLKPTFSLERHPSKDFSIQRMTEIDFERGMSTLSDIHNKQDSESEKHVDSVNRCPRNNQHEILKKPDNSELETTIVVAVEPPTSTSVTTSSTVNSFDQLCEKEDSPLLAAGGQKSGRKSGTSGLRFFHRHRQASPKEEIPTNAPIVISEKSEGEQASTSTGTVSEEHISLLSASAISQPRTLKRCLRSALRRISKPENTVPNKRKNPTARNVRMKYYGVTTVNLDADNSNRDISLTHFHPKTSSSTEFSFSRQTSSVTSCCTPPYDQSARKTFQPHPSTRSKSIGANPIGVFPPSLPFPPPLYHPEYARAFPEFQYLNRAYSPTYYTTSRKVKKTSRMTQGPQRYFFFSDIVLDFCARTSSHGIPFIGTHSFFGRVIWSVITIFAFLAFCIQTYFTLYDYLQYRTIIEMQLKFEPAPFPAATLCNLNSFKYSELRKFEEIGQGFKLWEEAISKLDRDERNRSGRVRRQINYRPVYARCVCTRPGDQCVPQRNELDTDAAVCICFEDAQTGDIWPCYAQTDWTKQTCFYCSNAGTCEHPDKPPSLPNDTSLTTIEIDKSDPKFCICQSVSHYCLASNPSDEIQWWNPYNYTVFPATEPPTTSPEIAEAFGLDNLHDRGAITTRTKENLIFLVAAMPRETRRQLSYTLDEFVLRCSFNSKDCDLERDFQIQIDPEYGNCYTFNFNDSVELKNSRAGPMYGLRLLLNVNQSDYMPTTEAAGVRLVVHEQDQEPFPDTFGYSAPTGFVSSFGLKTKVLNRLDAPYGKCSDTFRPEGYIYAEHYSPEGCYRNCFQQIIIKRCGCGDPRFPMPLEGDFKPCDARAAAERACLANETSVLGGFHHLTHDCHCIQPCTENVFETAYSAAAWPAINFKIGEDCAGVLGDEAGNFTEEECTEYYRRNTAYIEIYYEQLNFEYLKETAGYTMVNLFSDLGGNIGLWIGFSLITVLEFIEFFCECIAFGLRSCVVQRLFGRRVSSKCSGSRTESMRNGRAEANATAADNFSAISAPADSTVEIGHSAAAAALDDEHLTPRRSSIVEDNKSAAFYHHYDPRRNTAASKQWRRRVWEMQQRQWEEWRRHQEELLMQQHSMDEESASVDRGTTLPSLAAAFSMFGIPKPNQGAPFASRVDKVTEEPVDNSPSSRTNDYQPESSENITARTSATTSTNRSADTVIISETAVQSPLDSTRKITRKTTNMTEGIEPSESINLMRFESIEDEPACSSVDVGLSARNKSGFTSEASPKHAGVGKRSAPQKPPMSESLRMSFKK